MVSLRILMDRCAFWVLVWAWVQGEIEKGRWSNNSGAGIHRQESETSHALSPPPPTTRPNRTHPIKPSNPIPIHPPTARHHPITHTRTTQHHPQLTTPPGQQCYEGLKAFRAPDDKSIHIFRPRMNAERMQHSASFISIPEVPVELLSRLFRCLCRCGLWRGFGV